MKKTRLSIGLMTALLGVATLAGCNNEVTYSPSGSLITYTVGGETKTITSEDIFAEYYTDSTKYQSVFDAIKSIVIKNYFTIQEFAPNGTELGKVQLEELESLAQTDVDSDKHQAELNAQNNSTNYDEEFEKILKSKSVKTEKELYNKYLDQKKTEKFEENYYKYFLDEIKDGYTATDSSAEEKELAEFWTGYFNDMLPYHVSHILVKLEDSGSTNYYNGTISKENCERLFDIVKNLENAGNKNPSTTFNKIASSVWSGDSSKSQEGNLGIMDYNTSYVDEFKLGVYAYESIFGKSSDAKNSNIEIPEELESTFIEEAELSYGSEIPTVDISVFETLEAVKDKTQTKDEESVMGGSSLVYPRNVVYNQYLNRHSFAFVTGTLDGNENFVKKDGFYEEGKTGLHRYTASENSKLASLGKPVLSTVVANEIKPILMVRAGSSDYQGIHFIVINRDPFTETDKLGVNLKDYYTTSYITDKKTFPQDNNGNPLPTYANFNLNDDKDINTRVDSFRSHIKSYNSEKLSRFIFKKYMRKENIKISDPKLEDALNSWIDNTTEKEADTKKESWERSWNDYVGVLRKQNSSRNNLMPQATRIAFEDDIKLTDTIRSIKDKFISYLVKYGYTSEKALEIYNDYAKDIVHKYTVTSGDDTFEITVRDDDYENMASSYVDCKIDNTDWTIADLYNVRGALCNDGKTH